PHQPGQPADGVRRRHHPLPQDRLHPGKRPDARARRAHEPGGQRGGCRMSTQAGAPMDDDQEYAEGHAAGLVWLLTADGRAYLDPDSPDTDYVSWPSNPARDRPGQVLVGPYNQAVSDA